ncbi:MAG: hypothetical protein ACK4EY_03005 [Flavipsychrobacter sp.]
MVVEKKHTVAFWLIILVLVAAWFYVGRTDYDTLQKNHLITNGVVIDVGYGGRYSTCMHVSYVYYADGLEKGGNTQNCRLKANTSALVGWSFPVVYMEIGSKYVDDILITPNDFKHYGYAFPDSLTWVLAYLNK